MNVRQLIYAVALTSVVGELGNSVDETDIMILTGNSFDETVLNNSHIMVQFYAPWCVHCKELDTEYKKVAAQMKKENLDVKVAKVDATTEVALAEKFKVTSFPTIKFFVEGKHIDYTGIRLASHMLNWIKRKYIHSLKFLNTLLEIEYFLRSTDVAVLAFFSLKNSEKERAFFSVGKQFEFIPFGMIGSLQLASSLGVGENKMVLFQNFDEERIDYTGNMQENDILAFVREHQFPLITEFNEETSNKIFVKTTSWYVFIFLSKSSNSFAHIYTELKKTASKFKGTAMFVYVDIDVQENNRVMENFEIKSCNCPSYCVVKAQGTLEKFIAPDSNLSTNAMVYFVSQVIDGKVKSYRKSEELQSDWNKHPVTTLVGTNFREIALDANKKVFVEIYAPWCIHCKKLEAIWEQLGEHFAENDDVIIAKVDASANEIREIDVKGFPTLALFPDQYLHNIVVYNGKRTFESLVQFVDSYQKDEAIYKKEEL